MLSHERIAEIAERVGASDPADSFWREFAQSVEREVLDCGPSGMTQVPVKTLGKMHDRIAALEAAERRYLWLTRHAYIGDCFTDEGTILEVQNMNSRVPIAGDVDRAIDAAIAAETAHGVLGRDSEPVSGKTLIDGGRGSE